MNEKDLKKLEVFKNTEKDNNFPQTLNNIHETDTYYIASDGYRSSILFKDINNRYISKNKNENVLEKFANLMMNQLEINEVELQINRKDILKLLKELWVESQKVNRLYKKKRVVKMSFDYDNFIINISSDGINKQIKFQSEKHLYDCDKKSLDNMGFTYQYLYDFFNYLDIDIVNVKFISKLNPIICETADKITMLLPVRMEE